MSSSWEPEVRSPARTAEIRSVTYHVKVWLWDLRRRRLVRRLVRRGATAFEVSSALRADVSAHPHPNG